MLKQPLCFVKWIDNLMLIDRSIGRLPQLLQLKSKFAKFEANQKCIIILKIKTQADLSVTKHSTEEFDSTLTCNYS